jgi:RecB family exonuclease
LGWDHTLPEDRALYPLLEWLGSQADLAIPTPSDSAHSLPVTQHYDSLTHEINATLTGETPLWCYPRNDLYTAYLVASLANASICSKLSSISEDSQNPTWSLVLSSPTLSRTWREYLDTEPTGYLAGYLASYFTEVSHRSRLLRDLIQDPLEKKSSYPVETWARMIDQRRWWGNLSGERTVVHSQWLRSLLLDYKARNPEKLAEWGLAGASFFPSHAFFSPDLQGDGRRDFFPHAYWWNSNSINESALRALMVHEHPPTVVTSHQLDTKIPSSWGWLAPEITVEPRPRTSQDNTWSTSVTPRWRDPHSILKLSASALDDYRQCPQYFYQRHVLKLKPPRPIKLDIPGDVVGQITHSVLRSFVLQYWIHNPYVQGLTLDAQRKALKQTITDQTRNFAKLYQKETPIGWALLIQRLESTLLTWLEHEIKLREWRPLRPLKVEWGFGSKKDLPFIVSHEGRKLALQGRLDRLDTNEANDEITIIDYKTGSQHSALEIRKFDSLQLPLYALAVKATLLPGAHRINLVYINLGSKPDWDGLAHEDSQDRPLVEKPRRQNRILSSAETHDFFEAVTRETLDTAQNIERGDWQPKPKNAHDCQRCLYLALCPRPAHIQNSGDIRV